MMMMMTIDYDDNNNNDNNGRMTVEYTYGDQSSLHPLKEKWSSGIFCNRELKGLENAIYHFSIFDICENGGDSKPLSTQVKSR